MSTWAEGTFAGSARALAAAVATTSPEERLQWLEQMLLLALESGALQREREARQRAVDELWLRDRTEGDSSQG